MHLDSLQSPKCTLLKLFIHPQVSKLNIYKIFISIKCISPTQTTSPPT